MRLPLEICCGRLDIIEMNKVLRSKPITMNGSKLMLNIGGLCLLGGPIFYILGLNMNKFYSGDVAWAPTLMLWTIALISVIIGIGLVIAGLLMKPKTDDDTITVDDAKLN